MSDQIGLGRLVSQDARDHQHLMPRRAAANAVTSRYWRTPLAYDQGSTSQCVAYAGVRYLVTSPVRNAEITFSDLYKDCQRIDEWPGENYDGTSVRALFKIFQQRQLVSEYLWAFDAGPVIDHLLTTGPVVVGTAWTASMANIGDDGYVTLGDLNVAIGGHAWCIVGANRRRRNPDGTYGAARAVNSWGRNWGPDKGRFWVKFSDLDALIKAEGEACVATEIKNLGQKISAQ